MSQDIRDTIEKLSSISEATPYDQVEDHGEEAFQVAIRHIQEKLGQTDGGFAGDFFSSGEGERAKQMIVRLLADYAAAEIKHRS